MLSFQTNNNVGTCSLPIRQEDPATKIRNPKDEWEESISSDSKPAGNEKSAS
jgi:hypothetical protein